MKIKIFNLIIKFEFIKKNNKIEDRFNVIRTNYFKIGDIVEVFYVPPYLCKFELEGTIGEIVHVSDYEDEVTVDIPMINYDVLVTLPSDCFVPFTRLKEVWEKVK